MRPLSFCVKGDKHPMEEIIVIRATDPDGSMFKAVIDALRDKSVQVVEATSSMLSFGDVEIYPASRRVLKAGREIRLNHSEYSILYCMAKSPGRIYTREQLYAAVWGEEYQYGMTTVDNTIWRLRKKLESDPRHPIFIKTVFRFGYKLDA